MKTYWNIFEGRKKGKYKDNFSLGKRGRWQRLKAGVASAQQTLLIFEVTHDTSELVKIFPELLQLKGSHTMFPAL